MLVMEAIKINQDKFSHFVGNFVILFSMQDAGMSTKICHLVSKVTN